MTVIEVTSLRKSFGDTVVLDDLTLRVRRGETLVILGGSGSGKSTLLRCMLGLETPDSGKVAVDGTDVHAASRAELVRLRQRTGVAFQAGALFGSLSVCQNVEVPLEEFTSLPASTRRVVAGIKLAMVGLGHALHRRPSELSGGMVKRAALARALALDPELVFFDEPSAGLDPVTGAGIDQLLLRLKEAFSVTLVVVTHELDSAFAIADRIAVMHQGRFRLVEPPEAVRASTDPIIRRFLDRRPPEPVGGADNLSRLVDQLD